MELPSTFTAIDIETTGIYPRDRIIEIAVVKCKKRKILKQYSSLIYTDKKICKKAQEVNGISQEMLKGKPQIWDALQKIKAIAGDSILVAHNSNFDKRFIQRAAKGCRIEMPNQWIDTMAIARKLLPSLSSYTLESIAKELRLEGKYHRALDDALITAYVYMDFWEMEDQELTIIKKKKRTKEKINANILKGMPAISGSEWTREETSKLEELFCHETSVEELACRLDRTHNEIVFQLEECGLLTLTESDEFRGRL